jgi:hypothetical protein
VGSIATYCNATISLVFSCCDQRHLPQRTRLRDLHCESLGIHYPRPSLIGSHMASETPPPGHFFPDLSLCPCGLSVCAPALRWQLSKFFVLLWCWSSAKGLRTSMSGLGHKRTFGEVETMSVLPAKADIDQYGCDVRFVPKQTLRSSSSPLGSVGRCTVEFSSAGGEAWKVPAHTRHILDRAKLEPIFARDVSLFAPARE